MTATPVSGLDSHEVLSWIEAIVALGERPPGSAGDRATRDYIKNQLRCFGFDRIEVQPFPVKTCVFDGANQAPFRHEMGVQVFNLQKRIRGFHIALSM